MTGVLKVVKRVITVGRGNLYRERAKEREREMLYGMRILSIGGILVRAMAATYNCHVFTDG